MPVIVVQASMAGASPDIMASTVAEPLERRLATISGVTELTSTNSVGSSSVVIQFAINRDINGAARDVEAGIQAARADLPTTLRGNPSYREYNPADSPIIILRVDLEHAHHRPVVRLGRHGDPAAAVANQPESDRSSSEAALCLRSASRSSPTSSSSYGIGLEDVRAAISSANADSAKGYIEQGISAMR